MEIKTGKVSMHKLFCLMGPSGTGKSALATSLKLPYAKFHITRSQRTDEIHGTHSYFVSHEEYEAYGKKHGWVCQTNFADNHYGLSWEEVQQLQKSPMVCITDEHNFLQIREAFTKNGVSEDNVIGVYIDSPLGCLVERMALQKRSVQEIQKRISKYEEECKRREHCRYHVSNPDGQFKETILKMYEVIVEECFSSI